MNLIATGSTDHVVRLWNPYVTSKPVAELRGHSMSIVDLVLREKSNQLFSYSREAVSARVLLIFSNYIVNFLLINIYLSDAELVPKKNNALNVM